MRPSVKICGLTRPEDLSAAIGAGAGFLGFVVEAESPRKLSLAPATKLAMPALGIIPRVAVCVNPSQKLSAQIAAHMRADFIQLHGAETPAQAQGIKSATGLGIIKALAIREKSDLDKIAAYQGIADYILLDAKPPKTARQKGGHGVSFNWKLLDGFTSPVPLILAGGLTPQTLKAAQRTGIKFFDVSSGVERKPGIKDACLIAQFMKAAHE